jgi:hypothetical protein
MKMFFCKQIYTKNLNQIEQEDNLDYRGFKLVRFCCNTALTWDSTILPGLVLHTARIAKLFHNDNNNSYLLAWDRV